MFTAFFLSYIIIHIPFSEYNTSVEIKELFRYSIVKESKSIYPPKKIDSFSNFTFDVENKENYEIYTINSNAHLKRKFLLPPQKPELPEGALKSWPNSDGFITYPVNGNFFIWYPRLGRYVYYFDEKGDFLFEKESSHYLQSFSTGAWILALAGDHSRAHILKPGLQPLIDVEGMLLVDYKISNDKSFALQICAVFLDGDIVFISPNKPKKYRISLGVPVKSISCDFENENFAVQAEMTVKIKDHEDKVIEKTTDVILTAKLLLPEKENENIKYEIISEYILDKVYSDTLPLAYNQEEYVLIMLPDNRVKIFSDNIQYELNLSEYRENSVNIDDYRAINIKKSVILWGQNDYYIFQKEGLSFYQKKDIVNITALRNIMTLQDEYGLQAISLKSQ
ncbi:MAG: hypothetical protein OEZ13_11635 [Spirochaetia bacterium]|nr:hypothetical protein [Spirochaetia bacterium]